VSPRPGEVLVLEYHAVSETWPAALAVTPAQLRRQLEWLTARGYRGATFHEALTRPARPRTLVVTFDDAYRSVLERAYPILSALGIPGTVFAVTGFAASARQLEWPGIDQWQGGPHDDELQGLEWHELRRLADEGWEIGSHTRTHPHLTSLPDAALESELRVAREECEQALGRPCHSLAYPYGDFDARVVAAAVAAGYEVAAIEGLAVPRLLAWPRVGVYRKNSMAAFRLKVSPLLGRLRTAAAPAERQRSRLAEGAA
jgi:peptidoglycan/xylan/chitin deacetylase (PgdA/CDA1 family)